MASNRNSEPGCIINQHSPGGDFAAISNAHHDMLLICSVLISPLLPTAKLKFSVTTQPRFTTFSSQVIAPYTGFTIKPRTKTIRTVFSDVEDPRYGLQQQALYSF